MLTGYAKYCIIDSMNTNELIALYLIITGTVGTITIAKAIIRKLLPKDDSHKNQQVSTIIPQTAPTIVYREKIDKRQKFAVNVQACEQYLASRK